MVIILLNFTVSSVCVGCRGEMTLPEAQRGPEVSHSLPGWRRAVPWNLVSSSALVALPNTLRSEVKHSFPDLCLL